MSDEPYQIPPVPSVTAERARDIARVMQAFATQMEELGNTTEARRAERLSQWWQTHAITFAQTQRKGEPCDPTNEQLVAKLRQMNTETEKFVAEQRELIAGAQKMTWDARFAPYLAIAAVIGGLLGIATFIAHLMGH